MIIPKDSVEQKKISKISVDIRKEDTETDGIKKKVIAVRIASSLLSINFFDRKKITQEVRKYRRTGIILITKKLLPK